MTIPRRIDGPNAYTEKDETMHTTTHNPSHQSSVDVRPWEVGDMIVVDHFTGTLLMGQFEANHLRTLLNRALADVPEMPIDEAEALRAEREAALAPYLAS